MSITEELGVLKKETQVWLKSLDTSLTELLALKESIREIYNIDNRVATKLIPFEGAVNNSIVKTKDLMAKIRIQADEAMYLNTNRPERVKHYKSSVSRLKKELMKKHEDHLELMNNFFNEIII